MALRLFIVLGFALGFANDGSRAGREGNKKYADEAYAEAAALYREGVQAASEIPGRTPFALQNNLGSASYRMGDYANASAAFSHALALADNSSDYSRAAYNAGNAAFQQSQLETALVYFRQALIADPQNEAARFNYEFVMRQLTDEQPEGGQPPPDRIRPSEYAMQVKARADALVARRQYFEAHDVMLQGRRVDPTVDAFKDFIERLRGVSEIDALP